MRAQEAVAFAWSFGTDLSFKGDEEWKLIYRHADPLMEKTAADTVLQE